MKKNSSIPKAGFRLFRPNPRMFGKLFALFIFMTFCTYSYGVSQNKKMDVHFNNASIDFVIVPRIGNGLHVRVQRHG